MRARTLPESGDSGKTRGAASRPVSVLARAARPPAVHAVPLGLPARLMANALALDALVSQPGRIPAPLLRSLADDLRDFAQEAESYEEARVFLGEYDR